MFKPDILDTYELLADRRGLISGAVINYNDFNA
jgi:hypothetical protein